MDIVERIKRGPITATLANEAADEITRLRSVIAEANNSLLGTHAFFIGSNRERHLSNEIENLKETANKRWEETTLLRSQLAKAMEGLRPFVKYATSNGCKCPFCAARNILKEIEG